MVEDTGAARSRAQGRTAPAQRMRRGLRATRDAATVAAFATGWKVMGHLPPPWIARGSCIVADRASLRGGSGARMLRSNYSRVRPDLDPTGLESLAAAGMRSYLRYFTEMFALRPDAPETIYRRFHVEDADMLDRRFRRGTGMIMAAGHCGNWDLSGVWMATRFGRVTTVAEKIKPQGVFDRFTRARSRFGIEILPHGQPGNMDRLRERVSAGGVVALMADRDISRRGLAVEFFSAPASLPVGPAVLAVDTGAPLFAVDMWFDANGSRARVIREVPVPTQGSREGRIAAVTQSLAGALEEGIREHTVDWHMLQPVWLADLHRPPLAATASG